MTLLKMQGHANDSQNFSSSSHESVGGETDSDRARLFAVDMRGRFAEERLGQGQLSIRYLCKCVWLC